MPSTSARFNGHDAATVEAREIVRAQIANALATLKGRAVSDSSVHSARKLMKKARATLRLLRDALPDAVYRLENAALRDAARPLSATRNAKVLIEALDRLIDVYGDAARASAPQGLRRALVRERNAIKRGARMSRSGLEQSRRSLRASLERSAAWPVGRKGWSIVGQGLRRTYARGRRSFAESREEHAAESLHEWRKQVQYLWHQSELMVPLSPGRIGELADQLHKLSDYLGDDHDLVVLREKIVAHKSVFADAARQAKLLAFVERRRTALQDKAFVLGARLYEETPSQFAARFGRYWREWRHARAARSA